MTAPVKPGTPEAMTQVERVIISARDETDRAKHFTLAEEDVFDITRSVAEPEANGPADFSLDAIERPKPRLDDAALYGPVGEWVRLIAPHTEASVAALLFCALVAVGALIGRGVQTRLDGARHGVNLFALLVGLTGSGRKGTAVAWGRRLIAALDADFAKANVASGLSSGQGLIYHIRDPLVAADGEKPADPGVPDKRILILESEFAGPLKQMHGDSNTLSAVIRDAWDGYPLRTLTRRDAMIATDPHVAIIAQITPEELHHRLDGTELSNGFANRFLTVWTERARLLPFSSEPDEHAWDDVVDRLSFALTSARRIGSLDTLTPAAREWWGDHYAELTCDRPGRAGKATQRAAPQLRRIALLLAALDGARVVDVQHLAAANAVWQYAADSAAYVFAASELSGKAKRAEEILRFAGRDGMSRTPLAERTFRSKSVSRDEIEVVFRELEQAGVASRSTAPTAGRPRELWTHAMYATPALLVVGVRDNGDYGEEGS